MTDYQYDLTEMEAAHAALGKYLRQVNDALGNVESVVAGVRQSWDGTAAAAYEQRHRDWIEQSRVMAEQLDDVGRRIDTARKVYESTMKINVGMFVQG